MPRPQFSLTTLLWLMAVVGLIGFFLAGPVMIAVYFIAVIFVGAATGRID